MAKAKSYKLQGREWTVKDLAEELGLSTPRVHGLLKEHNEDIKAIFESRGITPKAEDKGQRARLFDYKGKQWTVKQLAEEFGLSNVRVNRLIKEFDGDIEKIALSREKSKKKNGASEIQKQKINKSSKVLYKRSHYGSDWNESSTGDDSVKYEGEVENGIPNGIGQCVWSHGKKYVGEWKNGKQNGQGTETGSDGRKYEGEFKNGECHGYGISTDPDGFKYEGEFEEGRFHGKGTKTETNGDKYEGEFKKGLFEGHGTLTYSNGQKQIGERRGGRLWNLTCYDKDGNISMEYVNGEIKKASETEKTDEKTITADSTSSQSLILKDQQDKILSEFGCKNAVGFWDFMVENYEKYVDLSKEMFDREFLIVAKKINKEVINLFYINFELCPGPSDVGHDYDRGLLAESAQICYDGEAGHKIKERTEEELNVELGFDLFEWFD